MMYREVAICAANSWVNNDVGPNAAEIRRVGEFRV